MDQLDSAAPVESSVPAPVDQAAAPAPVRFATGPLVVLSLVNFVDQIDTSILRGVLPLLERQWGLSDTQLGLLGFSFIFVHTIAAIPAGYMADRYRRARIIGFTLLSWSALSALAAGAVNFMNLFFARAALGLGQALDDPSSTSLLADYYPARQRGRIFSIQQIMATVGGPLGLLLGAFVGTRLGWRWAFLLVGAPGSIVALMVFRLREPVRGEADALALGREPSELAEPSAPSRSDGMAAFLRTAMRELVSEIRFVFSIPTMRYILVGVSTLLFTVSGVGYWLTVYHDRYSGMTPAQAAGVTAGVLGLGGLIGTLGGGAMADRVFSADPGRRISLVGGGILVCTGLFLVSYNVPVVPRMALQLAGVVAITSAFPGLRASMMDVVPARSRGVSASAFALTSAMFGTALAPPLVGVLSDMTSLLGAYYIVTPPIFVGTAILLRARKTVARDAQAILQAIVERSATAAD